MENLSFSSMIFPGINLHFDRGFPSHIWWHQRASETMNHEAFLGFAKGFPQKKTEIPHFQDDIMSMGIPGS